MPVSSRRRSTVLSQFPAIALLTFAVGLAGCGDSGPSAPSAPGSPSHPSAASTPTPKSGLTVFTDGATGFSTTDLRDVQEQIVQLSSIGELIWTADGTRLPGYPAYPFRPGLQVAFISGKICPEAVRLRSSLRDERRREAGLPDRRPCPLEPGHPRRRRGRRWRAGRDGNGRVSPWQPHALWRGHGSNVEGPGTGRGGRGVAFGGTGWRSATTDKNGLYRIQGLYDGPPRSTPARTVTTTTTEPSRSAATRDTTSSSSEVTSRPGSLQCHPPVSGRGQP